MYLYCTNPNCINYEKAIPADKVYPLKENEDVAVCEFCNDILEIV